MPNCMPFPYTYPAHLSSQFLEAKCDTMNFPHNFAREPEVFFGCFKLSVYECRRKTLIAIFSFAHFVAEPGSFYGCSGASPPKCKTVWRTPGKYLQPVCVCVCVWSRSVCGCNTTRSLVSSLTADRILISRRPTGFGFYAFSPREFWLWFGSLRYCLAMVKSVIFVRVRGLIENSKLHF